MDLVLDAICVVDSEGRFVYVSTGCERLLGYTQAELIGRYMIEFVFSEDRDRTLQAAADIMRGHPKLNFENRYVRKDGGIVHIMWSARWSEADRVRVAVARDVTDLKKSAHVQEALFQIANAANASDDLPALCKYIHQAIGKLIQAENFLVALYDASNNTLTFPYIVDSRENISPHQSLQNEARITKIIHTGRALLINDSDIDGDNYISSNVSNKCLNWLGIPLCSQIGTIGALVIHSSSGNIGYTENNKNILQYISTKISNVIERKQSEVKLRHLAGHDELTNLPNRSLFNDRFSVALNRAHRDNEQLALLYLDLDGFKQINDNYGHEIGDQLLREVAQRLTQCVRKSDTIGRRGGDEFTALLTNIQGIDSIDIIIKKIHDSINQPFNVKGHPLRLSISIGSAIYPDNGDNIEQLIQYADSCMYAIKRHINSAE